MTQEVILSPGNTVKDVIDLIKRTGHDGFPVVEFGKVTGYVSASGLLEKALDQKISHVMSRDVRSQILKWK